MVHAVMLTTAAAAALLLALPVTAAGLYPKSSAVLQVNAKNYDRLIAKSNHTSIVEFYAPWCGHCKSLQPAYETAAKKLKGLAKVAAVNCDEDENKQFCGSMGVKGFPTLKIVKPSKTNGKPVVEDYSGPREAKDIIDAVSGKIPNHVQRLADKDVEAFLAEANTTAKVILFTEKGTTSALLKAVAIDFLGSIKVAQIRSKETGSVELFGITKFPTILLLPGDKEAEGVIYDGEINKDEIVKFLSQIAPPNPDPAPLKVKMPKGGETDKKAEKSDRAAKESFESASTSQEPEASASAASATAETVQEAAKPTETIDFTFTAEPTPVVVEAPIPPVPTLDVEALAKTCLGERAGTCVLAFVPAAHIEDKVANEALHSLAEIAHKHSQAGRKIFPFYAIPSDNPAATEIKTGLGLTGDVEIVAVNRKRGWWRHFEVGTDPTVEAVKIWIDAIRMGEGTKQKFPEGLMPQKVPSEATGEQPIEERKPIVTEDEATPEPEATPETTAENLADEKTSPPTEEATLKPHDEL